MINIELQKRFFQEKEKMLIEDNELKVSIFQYDTGISAVKMQNSLGYIIMLPYNGQMIWDAVFL